MSDDKPKTKPEKTSNADQKPSSSASSSQQQFKRSQEQYPQPQVEVKVEQVTPPKSLTTDNKEGDKNKSGTKGESVPQVSTLGTKEKVRGSINVDENNPFTSLLQSTGDLQAENASRAGNSLSQADPVYSSQETPELQRIRLASDSHSEDDMSAPRFCLTKENYDTWIVRMKCLLIEKKLWLSPDTNFTNADRAVTDKAADGYAKIIKHCDDDAVRFLEANDKENSVFALKALEERKEGEGPISKVQIINEIAALKWTGGLLEEHIDRLQQKYRMLASKGFDVPEVIQVSNLMCSVGDKFSGVFSSFICGEETKMTFDRVSRALLAEQCRRSVASGPQPSEPIASIANKPGMSHSSRTRELRKTRGRCSHCNKDGHTVDKCFLKHGRPQQPSLKNTKVKANSAHIKNDASSEDEEPPASLYSHSAFTATRAKMAKHNAKSKSQRSVKQSSPRIIRDMDDGADLRNLIEKKQQLRSVVIIPSHSKSAALSSAKPSRRTSTLTSTMSQLPPNLKCHLN